MGPRRLLGRGWGPCEALHPVSPRLLCRDTAPARVLTKATALLEHVMVTHGAASRARKDGSHLEGNLTRRAQSNPTRQALHKCTWVKLHKLGRT